MAPKIAIIYYSTWGHVAKLAAAEKAGIESAGGSADIYRIDETLPADVLTKMHAPPADTSVPVITAEKITEYDAFLFGIPTRYGNYSAQWKTFIDRLGGLWQSGALYGKYFGLFISTGTLGGGQEATAINALSSWVHQGMIYVPLGYATTFALLGDLSEVRGGTPWGAGTFSGADGSRSPSEKEIALATEQGKSFFNIVNKVNFA
ncbi:Minor allergen Cla h 7 [Exophiala mesophila]|uniref:Minor allergen Cla h 7 n=1 Tax=Exophiala mesophila TaxID=212818 RepID=A0A438N7X4_EXOME|nr:Minor allergen Cla h 7 [Exophiala mesophila]